MNTITDTTVVSPRRIAVTLIVGSMIIPAIGLFGWLSNALLFAGFGVKNIPMAPSTAICFILLGAPLLMMFRPSLPKFWVIVIGAVSSIVTLYGLLTFIGLNTELTILPDNLFFPIMGTLDGIPMGRMASPTGFLFVFSGISLLFTLAALYRVEQSGLWKFWAGLSGGIVLFVGFLFFVGYLINSPLFYGTGAIPMALTTSITFMLLGGSLLMMLNSQTNKFTLSLTMLENLKIGTQLKIGFATLLLFVIVLGSISYQQSDKIHLQAENMYNHPLNVRRSIDELTASIYSIRVDMKNLALEGFIDEADKDNLHEANNISLELLNTKVFDEIEILRNTYLGPADDIDSLELEFEKWKSIRDETIRLHIAGKTQEAAGRSSITGVGVQQAQVVLRSLEKISLFATGKGDELYTTSQKLNNSLKWQLLFLTAIIVLISLLISYLLIRAVRKPIDELIEATQRFRKGDFTSRSAYISQNEFGELSNSFNTLADGIQASMSLNEKIENISGLMLSEDDAKIFFQKTLHALSVYTDSQIAAVYILNNDNKTYEHFESIGLDSNAKQSFTAVNFEGEFGLTLSSRKVQHIKNIPEDTRFVFHTVSGKFFPREILTVPVQTNKGVIAIISLASIGLYSKQSIQLIDKILITLSNRVEGLLAYGKIKEFSAKLEKQNSELEAQKTELASQSVELIEQNTELELQKKQLSQANQLKTSFLSNMSHELRTPLNSVIALSGVLNRKLDKKIPDKEYSYIEVIERNGKHLLNLINDILDISRIESGQEELIITRFNANLLIDELVSIISPLAKQKNIDLRYKKIDSELYINNDATKCRHILQNLISNAVKFTEKGQVVISTSLNDENFIISVKDTGIGVSENNLSYIFDEFRQADGSTSRKHGGTGLGLAIAMKYAKLLGGNITVESVVGSGSEFTLILPLLYDSEKGIPEEDITPGFSSNIKQESNKTLNESAYKTILLVEDSKPAIIQIKDFLEESGYRVLIARDGREALELIAHTVPDAMILDLMMPDVDGFEVLKTIREEDKTAFIPVLILTAKHITKEELRFLKQNNIHQIIQKGEVNRNELMNAVVAMVSNETELLVKAKPKLQTIKGKPVVLIVEDNPDNMLAAMAVLSDDFIVLEAIDGNEAVAMAKKHRPNLILMDISLPEMDGIEAFKKIRNDQELQHISVIALTASAMTQDKGVALAHGFDAFISKPFDEQEFVNTIKMTLYGK